MDDRSMGVRQGVDPYRQLEHTLREAQFGCFLVWVHNGEPVKCAKVSRPEVIEKLQAQDTVKGL